MRRAIALLTFGILASTPALTAQVGSMRITVPSPTASTLGKFGDIPVSLYTGVPDISIPLFTAQGRELSLPIVLKYHAGGIRVEEIGGWAGIGWTLEAGGTITRTVRGLRDDHGAGYYNSGHTFYNSAHWPEPTLAILQNLEIEQLDGEPDAFFFDFAGRSGQFIVGPTSTSTSIKEYRTIPHQRLRIEPSGPGFAAWVITTEDGTKYTFAAQETHTDFSLPSTADFPPHYGESYISTWHLTEIRSAGGDVITLGYAPYTARHKVGRYQEKFNFVISQGPSPCRPDQYELYNEYRVDGWQLATITAPRHTITVSTTMRGDALSPTGGQQERRLDRITVATPSGIVLRQFQFQHNYSTGRLTLASVAEQDRSGVSLPPYTFAYDAQPLPDLNSFAQDHWGFYNGANNSMLVPPVTYQGFVVSGAERRPNATTTRAGILTRITYPTGGYNEFVYESNDYGSVGSLENLPVVEGPLQSASLGSWEGSTLTFTVGGTHPTTGHAVRDQSPGDCDAQINPPCPYSGIAGVYGNQMSYDQRDVLLSPGQYTLEAYAAYPPNIPPAGGNASISVTWQDQGFDKKKVGGGLRVAEVRAADALGNLTVRKYRYTRQDDPDRSSGVISAEPRYAYSFSSTPCSYLSRSSTSKMPLGGGPPIGYSEVTVWHGANGEFGKTRHTFRSVLDVADAQPEDWPYLRATTYEYMRGQEVSATELNAAGQTQQHTVSTHTFPSEPETWRGFRGISLMTFKVGNSGIYMFNPFEVISAWTYVREDTTVSYNETGTASTTATRSYVYGNPIHLQLTQTTETNSDGVQRITRMTYPADYAPGSGSPEAAALTAMQGAAHIHNTVVERVVIEKNGVSEKILHGELTTFREYLTGQFRPYQRFVLNSASPLP